MWQALAWIVGIGVFGGSVKLAGDGVSSVVNSGTRAMKWGLVGFAGYTAAKYFKVI